LVTGIGISLIEDIGAIWLGPSTNTKENSLLDASKLAMLKEISVMASIEVPG
jgi:hypothetical protein